MERHRFVFLGGLHRSGTTLLARALAAHPDVSGFRDTGVPADEGQHLQTVYPPAKLYGGPGRFGFAPEAHLTEESPLVSDESRRLLVAQWSRHWDLEKPVLLEKSPPNLIKLRFLNALFPGSRFVVIVRHPIAVTLPTAQWRGTRRYHRLLEHWVRCHEVFAADRTRVEHVHVVRYEDLSTDPDRSLARVQEFLALEPRPLPHGVRAGVNERYYERWRALRRYPGMRAYLAWTTARYERRVRRFGYSLRDLDYVADPSSS